MIRILFICVTLVFLIVDGKWCWLFAIAFPTKSRLFRKPSQIVSRACDVIKEAHNGCKIENSQCLCSFGCKSEFRYQTKKECTDALKVLNKLGPFSCVCERSYLTSFCIFSLLNCISFRLCCKQLCKKHIIKSRSRSMLHSKGDFERYLLQSALH